MNTLIVIENPSKWDLNIEGAEIVKAETYLTDPSFLGRKKIKVLNLCKSYSYQSIGYYVSLVAAARGHYPIPSVKATLDFKYNMILKKVSGEIDQQIQQSLKRIIGNDFELSIYFGKNIANCHNKLSKMLFNLFPLPLFKAVFQKEGGKWHLQNIKLISLKEVPENHNHFLKQMIQEYVGKRRKVKSDSRELYRYELAILSSPDEKTPPSNSKAIQNFIKSSEKSGMSCQIITSNDYAEIEKFDCLFIRDTTAVNHYTYRFSRRAEKSGLVVIDDPVSILRCTNKIYLKELLEKNKIPAPKSIIISPQNSDEIQKAIGFPCVIKIPDSSFSLGVFKYDSREEFELEKNSLFKKSSLLLVQEFTPTEYDWRVGILNNQPIYVCRYFMAEKHWQIYNHKESDEGLAFGIPIEETPKIIIRTALEATKHIGDGLYGVDIKFFNKKAHVIEVNDNPTIETNIEDEVEGTLLYDTIIKDFIRRLDTIHGK